ncbi:HNH endonuclease [Actinotalea sp. M2MS4P-6]|uniref:HNH endonuclease signature motif containing protein n=1 Tax=Actinotalea sp. M2MS4P-6 TaxID=2983762 RepID=UPI0021E4AB44|nr:HNH endonuclease signature motif containing protein [Actinotalea sp. M2MS4P-6]MCV2396037.1 HNH endonuclease [Actinotalea sp. M2MS4P-6]
MRRGSDVATATAVSQLRNAVSALADLELSDVDGASGPGLHAELSRLAGRVQAVAARVLARVEADGRWQAGTSRTFEQWVAQREGGSVGAARREVGLGQALDGSLPRTAEAVAGGSMPFEHAQILASYGMSSDARRAALGSDDPEVNEAQLVRQAHRMGADRFRKVVQRWAHTVDAASAEAEHTAACEREHLTLTRRSDGVALTGFLTLEHGEALRIALDAVGGVPAADDPRTAEQRRAVALADAARLVLDRGLAGAGRAVRPHLSVVVSYESLQRQIGAAALHDGRTGADLDWLPDAWHTADRRADEPAELDDGTPIPPSVLARLACDSEISRIVFGPGDEVLNLGRSQRTYSGAQRRAVLARDRSCQFPGCGAPPGLGEVHHVDWWARDDGETDVARGILVCWHHHDLVHRRQLRITRDHRRWRFWRPDGTEVPDTAHLDHSAPPTETDRAERCLDLAERRLDLAEPCLDLAESA